MHDGDQRFGESRNMNEFWHGVAGVIIGSVLTMAIQWFKHRLETAEARKRDEKRKALLKTMLNNPGPKGWRTMKALSGVIGADRDETARLLIEIEARASETGNDSWAYLKDKPLPND